MVAPSPVRVGISVNLMPADPTRAVFKGKALQFCEEKLALAIHRSGAIPLILPNLGDEGGTTSLIEHVDGLVLSGGSDVSPRSYGEEPLDARWAGDWPRDQYEQQLVRLALQRSVPVLGICRGIQLLNVALGGSLLQDIGTQRSDSLVHRDWERYEIIEHPVRLEAGSWIAQIYDGQTDILVNTVHHQAIKTLAPRFRATAWAPDGIIEAAERIDADAWLVGLQWHPEWLDGSPPGGSRRAPGDPVFAAFTAVCHQRRPGRTP